MAASTPEQLAQEIAAAIAGEDTTQNSAVQTAEASSLKTKSGSGC